MTVDERVKGGVNQIKDLIVRPGMPVFLCILNILEGGNRSDQLVPEIARDQGVGPPDTLVGPDLMAQRYTMLQTEKRISRWILTSIPVSGSWIDA